MMQLTTKEHRVLDMLAKTGAIDWSRVHANTVNALRRKGLVDSSRDLTDAGRAARAAVPNIFDDLFDNKENTLVPKTSSKKATKKPYKSVDAFRPIEIAGTTLHDPVRERWEEGADKSGVRLYCTSSPITHGEENGCWSLQIFARVKIKRGGTGKHFAGSTASMSREDLLWLRGMIDEALEQGKSS